MQVVLNLAGDKPIGGWAKVHMRNLDYLVVK